MSLTRTLTLLVTATVLLITLAAALWSYRQSNHELEELFDAELAQQTRIIQGAVRHLVRSQSPKAMAHTLQQTLQPSGPLSAGEVRHKYEKKLALELWSPTGEPLLDTLDGADEPPLEPGFAQARTERHTWRIFTLRDPVNGYWVRLGQREDIRDELSRELAISNTLPLLTALPLLVVAVIAAIRLGFRPLHRLERPIRDMAPEKIHPLALHEAPQEVAGLVGAINGLLKRLEQALERERRFSSDAAHELRTPLAALQLNLERACAQHPETFTGLSRSVERMVHLVEQMLLLSRLESGGHAAPEPHDLLEVVAQGIADVAPLALERGVEPVLESRLDRAMCRCHPTLIATLMRSLLANAIRYSPSGSTVESALEAVETGYLLTICDQGPGIPETERAQALRRFVRLDRRTGSGAGLGLTIARRIAELHSGTLTLHDRSDGGSGLCVAVHLPVAGGLRLP